MREDKCVFLTLFTCSLVLLFIAVQNASSCNESICASQVSKCMLTQSCRCDLKNCSCCRDCRQCLSYLYTECCSCVGKWVLISTFASFHDLFFFRHVSKTEWDPKWALKTILHGWTWRDTRLLQSCRRYRCVTWVADIHVPSWLRFHSLWG